MKKLILDNAIILGDVLDFTYGDGIPAGTSVVEGMVIAPAGSTLWVDEDTWYIEHEGELFGI